MQTSNWGSNHIFGKHLKTCCLKWISLQIFIYMYIYCIYIYISIIGRSHDDLMDISSSLLHQFEWWIIFSLRTCNLPPIKKTGTSSSANICCRISRSSPVWSLPGGGDPFFLQFSHHAGWLERPVSALNFYSRSELESIADACWMVKSRLPLKPMGNPRVLYPQENFAPNKAPYFQGQWLLILYSLHKALFPWGGGITGVPLDSHDEIYTTDV